VIMRLALRPCASQPCPELVESGCCDAHRANETVRQYDRARRDDPNQIYHSTRWRRLRLIVLARDPVCRMCGQEASTDADHVVPITRGGAKWNLDNLQGFGPSCHAKKTRAEQARRGMGVGFVRPRPS
jgi:5-methylcytosine-specific restriction protein A